MRRSASLLLLLCLLALPCSPSWAGWLDNVWASAGPGADTTENELKAIAGVLGREAGQPGLTALGAAASAEGHWRFINASGETFTAATPAEIERAAAVLASPPAANAAAQDVKGPTLPPRLALHLTAGTVFRHRSQIRQLPGTARLFLSLGDVNFPLVRPERDAGDRLFAVVRQRVLVAITERAAFDEAIVLLSQPLDRSRIRVIGLVPGGPVRLSAMPDIDPAGRATVDAIEPDRLRHGLAALRGQTVVVLGRIAGGLLYFQPERGAERSLLLGDLTSAAAEADVNLLVITSSVSRQPGTRNWLWLKTQVSGLDEAMQRETFADFVAALGAGRPPLAITAVALGSARTHLEIRPVPGLVSALGGTSDRTFTSALNAVTAGFTGRIAADGIEASLRSAHREGELARRIVPGVPSLFQAGYLAALLLGVLGFSEARRWWQRIWPAEAPADYGHRLGYRIACGFRGLAFLTVFLPTAGFPALMVSSQRRIGAWLGRAAGRPGEARGVTPSPDAG